MLTLDNAVIYTPSKAIANAVLLIEDGKIVKCGPANETPVPPEAERLDLAGKSVFPGMIDVHIHGLLGRDTMGRGLAEVIPLLPRFGVTSFLAATVTLPLEEIYPRLREMAEALAAPPFGAECLGIHVEGPHLSPRRTGMANAAWVHPLTRAEFDQFQSAAEGRIRMITFAPEEGEALGLIPYLRENNVVAVIGHSDASYELVAEAVKLGLKHATHTFNAMRPLHHREPGVVGAVLAFPEIIAQLIADGQHVHPGAMRALLNAKGVEGVCLISDAAPFAGLPPGELDWEGYHIVIDEHTCHLPDGTLAGAHSLMDSGFRNLIQKVGLTPGEAATCASLVPARTLGVDNRKGRLLPGYDADLFVTDKDFQIQMTMVNGRIAWQK